MWVIDTPIGKGRAIDQPAHLLALATKTLANQETDDQRSLEMLELATKTDGNQESDDRFNCGWLDLSTKTAAELEVDDTRPATKHAFDL